MREGVTVTKKIKKPKPGRNVVQAAAARERRRSNAAAPHVDSRTQRQRTRGDQRRFAIRDGGVLAGAFA